MDYENSSTEVMWDFRQFYIEWVKVYIGQFTRAQLESNYIKMYESLRLWHSSIYGRSIKEFSDDNVRDKVFDRLINQLVEKSNDPKIKPTFIGRQKESVAIHELNLCIEAITIYLVYLMKKNKLFGDTTINRSL